jgi:formylglycine-generating enzyme
MKSCLSLILFVWASTSTFAQTTPNMLLIQGGTEILGGGYQFRIQDHYMVLLGGDANYTAKNDGQITIGEVPAPNNPTRQVTVHSFFLSETEVTNAQYREFLMDSLLRPTEKTALLRQLKAAQKDSAGGQRSLWKPLMEKAGAAALLPDTNCWVTDFSFASNEPLVHHYHWHPAFDAYPVVGVSWTQANAYCEWLTRHVNRQRLAEGKYAFPNYRLPTEMEWEFAGKDYRPDANGTNTNPTYPWLGNNIVNEKGKYRANIKTGPGDYIGDGYEYTSPVRAFNPNPLGLYAMAGNVAEWCDDVFRFQSDVVSKPEAGPRNGIRLFEAADESVPNEEQRVVKGGSWAEMIYAAQLGSRMGWPENRGSSRIGFRVAMTKLGNPYGDSKVSKRQREADAKAVGKMMGK